MESNASQAFQANLGPFKHTAITKYLIFIDVVVTIDLDAIGRS